MRDASGFDAPDEEAELMPPGTDLVSAEAAPEGVAVAHVTPRPDPTFVTHLIATANQIPQTRALRRAPPGEASSAYDSVAHHERRGPGRAMRRIV